MNVTIYQRVCKVARSRLIFAFSRSVDIFVTMRGLGPVAQLVEPVRLDPRNRLWEMVNA